LQKTKTGTRRDHPKTITKMKSFNLFIHHDPGNKNTEPLEEEMVNEGDPNFDESTTQGGEYLDDSLRMVEQPFEEE
jgi:hypothetical protein